MFTGTVVYSILFFAAALIVMLFAILYLIKVWKPAIASIRKAKEEGGSIPSITIPLVKTIVIVALFIVVITLGWNIKQSITTSISSYKSPAEISEQKKVQETKIPEVKELDKVRSEQKEWAEVKPHEKAFESFNEDMKREAEKIKQRSLGGAEKK